MSDLLKTTFVKVIPTEMTQYDKKVELLKFPGYLDMDHVLYFHLSCVDGPYIDITLANGEDITIEHDLDLFAQKYKHWKEEQRAFKVVHGRPN